MKLLSTIPFRSHRSPAEQAFTMVEFQISMAIILLVIAGVISSHVFGLKLNEATRAKLSASDAARNAVGKLVGDIRTAKVIQVGSGNYSSFVAIPNGQTQQGSSLRVYPGTNTNSFVVYYRDSSNTKLLRAVTNGVTPKTIAEYLKTNIVLFTSENFSGSPLTDNQNNRVIGVTLEFYQIQYPVTTIGQGGYFDYYKVSTKITRRALE